MAGEAPAGVAAHGGGGEGVEAQLGGAGVDVLRNGLEGLKVGDVAELIAGLRQQILVDDDAVALIAVADGAELAVGVVEVVGVGGQLTRDGGAGQVVAVVAPGVHGGLVADDEHRGRRFLIHRGGQGLVVGAGRGGLDGDGHTGLFGVHGGDLLQGAVRLGLEVQPEHTAGGLGGVTVAGGLLGRLVAAGNEAESHNKCQDKRKILLHVSLISLFKFIFTRSAREARFCRCTCRFYCAV